MILFFDKKQDIFTAKIQYNKAVKIEQPDVRRRAHIKMDTAFLRAKKVEDI